MPRHEVEIRKKKVNSMSDCCIQKERILLVDKDISIVGSFNLDIRSAYLDTEMMLLIKSNEFNAKLQDKMMQDAELCKHVLPDGSEKLGRNYERAEMTIKKRIVYSLLRMIIVPFRHLL